MKKTTQGESVFALTLKVFLLFMKNDDNQVVKNLKH